MGHLDGRLDSNKGPAEQPAGDAKDGPAGQKNVSAPKKEDTSEHSVEKASDVIHGGSDMPKR